ncbi:MAG TPA: penicillin-binding protein 2, partial [Acidiphilium sp.]
MTDPLLRTSDERRAWQRRYRHRLRLGMAVVVLIFLVVGARLVDVTVLHPLLPNPAVLAALRPDFSTRLPEPARAPIVDRNGLLLAVSLPGAALFGDPRQIRHPRRDALALARVIPGLDVERTAYRLGLRHYGFVYLDRHLTAAQELAVNRLGLPGIYFQKIWERHYPQGDLAAHILGGVTPGQHGIAGVEAYFDNRLRKEPGRPLRLSIDLRV